MTYDEALQAHVREFDAIARRICEIMLLPRYDNAESEEMKELQRELLRSIRRTFALKQACGHAMDLIKKEAPHAAK